MLDLSIYQEHRNGPLKPDAVAVLNDARLKYNWTYKILGERLGISGAFAHNIINKGGNITTNTVMPRIAEGIERLKAGDTSAAPQPIVDEGGIKMRQHAFHLRDNLQVVLDLPADLTEREAERLGLFIRSLAH